MKKNMLLLLYLLYSGVTICAQNLNGAYTLTSVATGKNLDGNEKNLYMLPPNGGDYQKWILKQKGTMQGRKVYNLTSVATGMCLKGDRERLYPDPPSDSRQQLWIIDPTTCPDCFTLTNLGAGRRLDGDGESLYPFDANDSNYQKWRIVVAEAPANKAITEGVSVENSILNSNSTTTVIKYGEWSPWQSCRFGQYRWRWGVNTLSSSFPQFVDVYYEVKNTTKNAVQATAGMYQCKNPEMSSNKYRQDFTLEAEQNGAYKVTTLNCGTADNPKVIKPYIFQRIKID